MCGGLLRTEELPPKFYHQPISSWGRMPPATGPIDPAPWLALRARPLSALWAMPGPGPDAGPPFLANPLIWFRQPVSGGHVVLKAMGVIVAAIA